MNYEWIASENILEKLQNFFNSDQSAKERLEIEVLTKNSIELNLLSETYRFKIFKKNSRNQPIFIFAKKLMEKSSHEDVDGEKVKNCFERELMVYRHFLSEIPQLLHSIGDTQRISPKLFDFSDKKNLVMLQDLSVQGFKSQAKYLKLPECESVFCQLAKLHALSYYSHHELGQDFRQFTNTICKSFSPTLKFMEKCFHTFFDEIKTWNEFSHEVDMIKKFIPHYIDTLIKETEPNPPGIGFNVFSHGDLHIGNILLKESTNEVILIDYQFSAWRSPAYDLFSTFNALCSAEVNVKYRNHLIRIYHQNFKGLLTALGFTQEIPTLLDVHLELLRHRFLDFFNWAFYLPLFLNYDQVETDFSTTFKASLQDPHYKMVIDAFLKKFIEKGFLENI